jgi:cell volume regulation protein A
MHEYSVEFVLAGLASLLLLSIFSSKAAGRLGVPALMAFLVIGMLAGPGGPGKLAITDPWTAELIGVTALVFITFNGGLDIEYERANTVIGGGISLATIGVLITALVIGGFAWWLGVSLPMAMLAGAVMSSTDAAAVFSVLGKSPAKIPARVKTLLEFESASNDPVAAILTMTFVGVAAAQSHAGGGGPVVKLFLQIIIGGGAGFLLGKCIVFVLNRIKLEYEGLYPVLSIALLLFTYGITAMIGGSGFLAVFIAGMIVGNSFFYQKLHLTHFYQGITWIMQIVMFIVLGLMVSFDALFDPQKLINRILTVLVLLFVARPAAVFISLSFTRLCVAEKLMVCWGGLKGATPIILATFPLSANVPYAKDLFEAVFFIVVSSVLFQATTLPFVVRYLSKYVPDRPR